jgi:hypothetical protein
VSAFSPNGLPEEERRQGAATAREPSVDDEREAVRASLLERLGKQIDLPAWLVAQGFHLSATQREPTQLALSDRHGETLYLKKDLDRRTWTYFTEREPVDRGTVVDLMVRRDAISLDECLNRLADCLDPSKRTREPAAYREALADRANTLHRAVARHVAALSLERDAERDLERLGVVRGTFDGWRFGAASAVLNDPQELGHSRYRQGDRAMVFVERPLDAIAYERVHGKQHATYLYVGDHPSEETKRKIAHVLANAPPELTVVVALAKDRRGAALAEEIADLAGHRIVERKTPQFGNRWADEMQIEQRHRDGLQRLHGRPDPVIENVRREMAKALDAGVDRAAVRTAIVRRPSRGRDGPDR